MYLYDKSRAQREGVTEKMAQQQTAEYMALEAMTEDLYNALPISDLLPKMISKRVITFPEKADIRAGGTTREQVDVFLSKLTGEMLSKENKRFYAFIEVMKESPKCDFLVERMEKWINHYKGTPPAIPAGKIIACLFMFALCLFILQPCTGHLSLHVLLKLLSKLKVFVMCYAGCFMRHVNSGVCVTHSISRWFPSVQLHYHEIEKLAD